MGLSQALATAVSGLRAAQTGLSIVSSNVANAETPGYVRKTPIQVTTTGGESGVGVKVAEIGRALDQFVQRQMRVESSGASYADLRAQFYDRLQGVYGAPGSESALETVFNKFTTALQALATSPDSASARSAVLSSAQVLTQQLNGMSSDIQGLRSDAELGLADAVQSANDAMTRIADLNKQLGTSTQNDATTASLLDQRDKAIDDLAQVMDINVLKGDHNQVTVFTNSGVQLVGLSAAQLAFDPQGSMTATAQWSADPSKRAVGTVVVRGPNGDDVDLIANKSIRSGKIAALVEMRDQVLVQAQTQLDSIAGALANALSDLTTPGTPVNPGAQGFDIDVGGLLNGNSVRIAYTDNLTNTQHTVTLVRVDDPSARPLANNATSDPNDQVVGLDFSGGLPSIVAQLNSALANSQMQFSNPSGTTLEILDDGAFNKIDVNSVSSTKTVTSLAGGIAQIPFFLDGSNPYTGAISPNGPQSVGLAGRIAVNGSLLANSSKLVVFQTSPLTPAGDGTRPNFMYDQLNNVALMFSPQTGVGTTTAPFSGSLPEFMRQVVSQQGDAAAAADSLKQGQDVVFNSLQQQFNESAGVNVDEEMANLLNLQNSYAANARVLSAVKDMATLTPVGGVPQSTSVDFTGLPNDGESIQYNFTLPDGTSDSITLTATTSTTPGPDHFTIGATPAATAASLQAALTASLGTHAATSLTAASAVAAGNDFFNTNSTHPPPRVGGPTPATATALVAGTTANTVFWYTGEDGPNSARSTATSQVDPSIGVSYGLRANEQGIRWQIQNLATLAAVTFSPSNPNSVVLAGELGQRVGANLDVPPGTQKVEDIEAELAGAQQTMTAAADRHRQTKSTLEDMLQQIEGVPTEQVAAQILALQTRLQAALQTTSLLYKTSLVNYI